MDTKTWLVTLTDSECRVEAKRLIIGDGGVLIFTDEAGEHLQGFAPGYWREARLLPNG